MLSTLTQTGMTNVQMTVWGKGCALLFQSNRYINVHFNNWHKFPLIG